MSPGAARRGSSASKSGTSPVTAAAASSSSGSATGEPSSSSHARTVSLSSHRPVTLWRKRTRPSTPPSFVKFAARAASLSTGASSSRPTRPHVPQEMYAASGELRGTAATAEAVSCEPTAITGSAAPTCVAATPETSPMRVPGSTIAGRTDAGMPSRAARSRSHRTGADVEQSGRRGVRALGRATARQQEGDEVGDEERDVGACQPVVRGELVERVERQELQTVPGVELVERCDRVHRLDAAGGAVVAVVERLGDEGAVADQAVVDGPRVDPDALQRRLALERDAGGRRGCARTAPRSPSGGRRRPATGPFGNRATGSSRSIPSSNRPIITRPLVAPRSTAATARTAPAVIGGRLRRRRSRPGCAVPWCGSARGRSARRPRRRRSRARPRA